MKPFAHEIPYADPVAAFAPLAGEPYSLFLDSADRAHPDARYSFIAAHPMEMIESKDGLITITNAQQQTTFAADPFKTVEARLRAWGLGADTIPDLPPFQGGAAGMFGYDLARQLEKIPSKNPVNKNVPDMAIGIYDQVMAFDHHREMAWLISHAEDAPLPAALRATPSPYWGERWGEGGMNRKREINWNSNFSPQSYQTQISRVIEYIRAGDIFQANLSQRFDATLSEDFDAFAHYLSLREINPAPFAAYMNLGYVKIASASPERFLTVKDRRVETKPIKGTKPRLPDPAADTAQAASLSASEKDLAENIMIVDLLRNDLSKVCEPASVAVENLCAVESFAGVHHLVSTISGTLNNDKSPLDLLRACFPGGSVTGAPKIRAMEIIEEIEPSRRGPYCGALGYIGFDGRMDMNILIRTLVYEGRRVSFQTGGGITVKSEQAEEYAETLIKAERIFESFKLQDASYKKTKIL